jgi:hypothetical protein
MSQGLGSTTLHTNMASRYRWYFTCISLIYSWITRPISHYSYVHGTFFCGLYPWLQKDDRLREKSVVFNVDGTTLLLTLAIMIKNLQFFLISRTCLFHLYSLVKVIRGLIEKLPYVHHYIDFGMWAHDKICLLYL